MREKLVRDSSYLGEGISAEGFSDFGEENFGKQNLQRRGYLPKGLRRRRMRTLEMLRRLDIVALCHQGVKQQYRSIYDRSISQIA